VDNRACYSITSPAPGHRQQPRSHRSLELALNSSTPLLENSRAQLPPDRLIHHFMPFALWYGLKRAKVDPGSGGFSDRVECCDATAARRGKMVTLIGPEISVDDLAVACKSTGREVLSHLGRRFHRIYHDT